jgi:hypothetical protein
MKNSKNCWVVLQQRSFFLQKTVKSYRTKTFSLTLSFQLLLLFLRKIEAETEVYLASRSKRKR